MHSWTAGQLRTFLDWSKENSHLHVAWWVLRALKRERGGLALLLARDDALVFGDAEGEHRHPERFSRGFKDQLKRCEKHLTKQERETLPEIRLHAAARQRQTDQGGVRAARPRERHRDSHRLRARPAR
jgi:homoserine trans-succinylase